MDYPGNNPKKRSSTLKIMLHPKMHEDLRVLADRLGQASATLASIAVSQYVAQQTAAIGASDRAMAGLFESMAPMMQGMFDSASQTPLEVLPGLSKPTAPVPRKASRKKVLR
jgi:predicted transcriptional regulator